MTSLTPPSSPRHGLPEPVDEPNLFENLAADEEFVNIEDIEFGVERLSTGSREALVGSSADGSFHCTTPSDANACEQVLEEPVPGPSGLIPACDWGDDDSEKLKENTLVPEPAECLDDFGFYAQLCSPDSFKSMRTKDLKKSFDWDTAFESVKSMHTKELKRTLDWDLSFEFAENAECESSLPKRLRLGEDDWETLPYELEVPPTVAPPSTPPRPADVVPSSQRSQELLEMDTHPLAYLGLVEGEMIAVHTGDGFVPCIFLGYGEDNEKIECLFLEQRKEGWVTSEKKVQLFHAHYFDRLTIKYFGPQESSKSNPKLMIFVFEENYWESAPPEQKKRHLPPSPPPSF